MQLCFLHINKTEYSVKIMMIVERVISVDKILYRVTVVGEGDKVKKSNVSPGEEIFSNDHIFLITDEPTMPNIKGWSLREVLQFGYLLELRTETIGEGYVIKQSIEEGTQIGRARVGKERREKC